MSERINRRAFCKLVVYGTGAVVFGPAISACNRILNTPTQEIKETPIPLSTPFNNLIPTEEPIVEPTNKFEPTPLPTRTPTPTPEPTRVPTITPETVTYPQNDARFLPFIENEADRENGNITLDEIVRRQSNEAEARLRELGAEDTVNEIKTLILDEMVRRMRSNTQVDPNTITRSTAENTIDWFFSLNESQAEKPGWVMLAREKTSKRFWWPRITSGEGAGARVIDARLASYLGVREGDFFDLELLDNPQGLGATQQVVLKDRSGWFVAGTVSENTKETYTWLNLRSSDNGRWQALSSFKPEGANRTEFRSGKWVAIDNQGSVRWEFNSENQEWDKLEEIGYWGSWQYSFENLPHELTTRLSPEQTAPLRFINNQGKPVPYGYYGIQQEYESGLVRAFVHLRWRGFLRWEDNNFEGFRNNNENSRVFLVDIPYEEANSDTGLLEEVGERQITIQNIPYQQANFGGGLAYLYQDRNVENPKGVFSESYTDIVKVLEKIPQGTSIMAVVQFNRTTSDANYDERIRGIWQDLQDRRISNCEDGLPTMADIGMDYSTFQSALP